MNERIETQSSKLNAIKWSFIAVIFIASLVLNSYYQMIPLPLRVIGWIIIFSVMLGIASLTSQGKKTIEFSKEARTELRKVIWPTRQETIQTTLMVIVFVTIMGLFLWALDSILLWVVGFLTGQRG